jgi:hypothetical protein
MASMMLCGAMVGTISREGLVGGIEQRLKLEFGLLSSAGHHQPCSNQEAY